jgi:hypothetical protein
MFNLALPRVVLPDEPFSTVKVDPVLLRPAARQPLTSVALMHSIASVPSLPICPVTARNIMPGIVFPDLFYREHHRQDYGVKLNAARSRKHHLGCPISKCRPTPPNGVDDTDIRPRTHFSAIITDNVYDTPPPTLHGISLTLNPIFIVLSTHIVRPVRTRRTGTVWTLPLGLLPISQSGICCYRTCFRQGMMSVDRRTWSGGIDEGPNDPLYLKPALSYKDRTLVVYLPLFGFALHHLSLLHIVPSIRFLVIQALVYYFQSQSTDTNNRHGGP